MKRIVRSEGYARARLLSGTLFGILGVIIAYRSVAAAGLALTALPGCVLGLAMLALGALRFRDYFAARRA